MCYAFQDVDFKTSLSFTLYRKPLTMNKYESCTLQWKFTFRQRGVLKFRDGTKQSDKQFINSFESTSNQPTSWLVHYWSTIGVRTSHGRPRTYKTHHNPNSGEATTFPHIIFFAPLCEVYIQMTLGGVLKLLRFGLLQFCGTKTPRSNLQLI